ncbi:DUF4424 domain-containing protein [Rhizobium hidalgonense]|uniref:DUF4424 domain-containing protein n=1 Tax=Rhizobium hidalgonense TaxID=1538159 RepID=A0ABX4JR06_9HYPH|nr:DUF4424 domain-containing protein [Rhizobium hidalgonense]MDR9812522.1 DUF4424 domain-containing protein [Rhizobium hidalgonense]PDT22508.1 hypothetical protein CO674_15740 [Rhizobium hidalgonense]PON09168.1 hypothetical protein ATY29_01505 [Rhizobium hidalgonense]
MLKLFTLLVAAGMASPALANDTMAEVRTGGLIFAQSDDVSMVEEDLFISASQVRVDYVFENTSDKDVDSLVAFPMPDISGQVDNNSAISDYDSDNFLHFSTVQDGRPITAKLQQRVVSLGIDVTDEFTKYGIPVLPYSQKTTEALSKLPDPVRKDWIARGLIYAMTDADLVPLWTLRSTYWWRTTFPAKKKVSVEHRYQPAVGGTVAISFLENGQPKGERFEEYSRKYCLDADFVRVAQQRAGEAETGGSNYTESWISYVLSTGANWAGPIKRFQLTIDKGKPGSLISFCGSNVQKIGSTTFRMTAEDFDPAKDFDILILNPPEAEPKQP